jgi:hypothetical protein
MFNDRVRVSRNEPGQNNSRVLFLGKVAKKSKAWLRQEETRDRRGGMDKEEGYKRKRRGLSTYGRAYRAHVVK